LTVLRLPLQELKKIPLPEDVPLMVETAATTLSMDLSTKADLYARAGIRDYGS